MGDQEGSREGERENNKLGRLRVHQPAQLSESQASDNTAMSVGAGQPHRGRWPKGALPAAPACSRPHSSQRTAHMYPSRSAAPPAGCIATHGIHVSSSTPAVKQQMAPSGRQASQAHGPSLTSLPMLSCRVLPYMLLSSAGSRGLQFAGSSLQFAGGHVQEATVETQVWIVNSRL